MQGAVPNWRTIMQFRLVCACLLTLTINLYATAQVAQFTNKQAWEASVGSSFTSIDFTGFQDGTMISNQYRNVGLTFTGFAQIWQTAGFVNDGWGVWGTNGLHMNFDTPQNWIAIDYPGAVRFNLFYQGVLFYTSSFLQPGGYGNFAGLTSSMPFDQVLLDKGPPGPYGVYIDDLYFGAPVPAPGAVALLALAGVVTPRRRRRS